MLLVNSTALTFRYSSHVRCSSAPTFTVTSWWVVEGQAQWDDGSDLQDDKCNVLQSFPHQLQEGLGLLWGDEVFPKRRVTFLQIDRVTRETCTHRTQGTDIIKSAQNRKYLEWALLDTQNNKILFFVERKKSTSVTVNACQEARKKKPRPLGRRNDKAQLTPPWSD